MRPSPIRRLLVAGVAIAPMYALAQAQTYPTRPIRIIVPFGTGGAPDIIGRLFAQEMSTSLGTTIVENRTGMGGSTGADAAAKSPADGYTLLMTTTATQSINPALYANIPYNATRDFTPVALVAYTPLMLVVANDVPAKSPRELIAHAKANPGKLSFASVGSGSMQHIAAELFKSETGIDMLHVPYKGSGQVLPDLVSGRVNVMFNSVAAVLPMVKEGKLRALAVTTAKRLGAAPNVPTLSESGVPGFEASAWYAIFAPAGLPRELTQRLNAEMTRIVNAARTRERFAQLGLDPATSSSDELAAIAKRDLDKWSRVIRDRGIRAE